MCANSTYIVRFDSTWFLLWMRLSFNLVNVYAKLVNVYQTFTRNMAANNKTQMVLHHDNRIIVSNSQQPPVSYSADFNAVHHLFEPKFHYASWFEAGSKLVADRFEAGSKLVATSFEPASNHLA